MLVILFFDMLLKFKHDQTCSDCIVIIINSEILNFHCLAYFSSQLLFFSIDHLDLYVSELLMTIYNSLIGSHVEILLSLTPEKQDCSGCY